MKKFLKWTGILFGGLFVLILLAGLVLYPVGKKKLTQSYSDIRVDPVNFTADADAVARGRHIAVIWACTRCHGDDLSGKLINKDPISGSIPIFGSVPAGNLTPGKGGVGGYYTNIDWVRAIRHGIKPGNQAEVLMFDYSTISDQDLGDLIAYLKQIPPVDKNFPAISYGPLIPVFPALGIFSPATTMNHQNKTHPAYVPNSASPEYGRYLFTTCAQCHGAGFAHTMKNWKQDDFIRTFKSGTLPNGKFFGSTMSSNTITEMNDTELAALWLYVANSKH
jgi:mono/diheme cytochrome c family protein